MHRKIAKYIRAWKARGYSDDIPDEVPDALMRQMLAPSYRAICIAILCNDHPLRSLGFSPEDSPWYIELKRIEIAARPSSGPLQLDFFR
jgi:predicted phosphoadenosine phosphosulfate sulfurtransferase